MRVRLALVDLPLAVSVALSLCPLLFGAYWTGTVQDLLGPRLLPLHPLLLIVKADDPDSVNVTDFVAPATSVS
jgi:hypothetical protein